MKAHAITMLGTGLIGDFYTMTLHGQRRADRVRVAYSRTEARGKAFGERWSIPESTTDMAAAMGHDAGATVGQWHSERSKKHNEDKQTGDHLQGS